MSHPNKAFVRSVNLNYGTIEDGTTGGIIELQFLVLDPDGQPVAGGIRLAHAGGIGYDDSEHDVRDKIVAACRANMNDQTLDVTFLGV